ncbi:translocation/assembly module TamB domain-containing protein [Dechloromonas sp.]|uniref:translocation/assembly module TamB domain-containing protein n=1 Tax=Dechloromonas sp. TaxID=1917218 RepID=UPI001216C5A9|nr:translocation/assembly module TamB domain-containing protein [Dechloromonas sp.]MBU3697971.1 hypothetical protein [Dechloromonas sp.]TEX49712.1 MAG: hypothetical protein CFR70_01645 [Rhodocyclaceae bacterium]
MRAAPPLPPQPPPTPRRRALLAMLALPVLIAAPLAWLVSSESGLSASLALARHLSGDRLQVGEAHGRLLGPLQIGSLRWQDGDLDLHIEQLGIAWSPPALLDSRLDVAEARIGRLSLKIASTPGPTPLPASLQLPLVVNLKKLTISEVFWNDRRLARDVSARLDSDGLQHSVAQLSATLDAGQLTADGRIDGAAPFATTATAHITSQLAEQPLQVAVQADGPLATLPLRAQASGRLQGQADITLTPFAATPFTQARAALSGLDPADWVTGAPRATLDVELDAQPHDDGLRGTFEIRNRQPGPLDRQRLPISLLRGRLAGDEAALQFSALDARLGPPQRTDNRLSGDGRWQNGQLTLALQAHGLNAASLASQLRPTAFTGPLRAELGARTQSLTLDLKEARFSLRADAAYEKQRLRLSQLEVAAGNARMSAEGEVDVGTDRSFRLAGQLQRFDLARFARLPSADINARFKAQGRLASGAPVEASFDIADSQFAGQPLSGRGQIVANWPQIQRADIILKVGANQLQATGAFGRVTDFLTLRIDAPQLGLLAPLGLDGDVHGEAELRGSREQPALSARLHSRQLRLPGAIRLRGAELHATLAGAPAAPLHLNLQLARLGKGDTPDLLRDLQLRVEGSNARHTLQASVAQSQHQLTLSADGGFDGAPTAGRWRGQLLTAQFQAEDVARSFQLSTPAALAISPQAWQFGPAQLYGTPLDWQATLHAGADGNTLRAGLSGRGRRIGKVDGELAAALMSPWALADDQPWRGRLATDIADLGWLGELIGEGWQTGGRLQGEATLTGTPRRPLLNGRWQGEALALGLPDQGLQLTDGTLAAQLDDNRLRVERLVFDSRSRPPPRALRLADPEAIARLTSRPGRLEISGEMAFDRSASGADRAALDIRLERLGAWQGNDQWILLSGENRLTWENTPQGSGFGLRGKLAADAGYWQLAPGGVPRLSDDVIIRRAGDIRSDTKNAPAATLRPTLDLDLSADPGPLFLFNGSGLSARLGGQLQITGRGRDLPRAIGTIRTRDGRFAAYGQQLELERGILSFHGLLDNPALDVRAVRRGLAVEPGVQISGNARRPVIRLISDPELPDTEKLAWLVLGHGPEQMSASDATVLLGAAGGLLGNDSGNIVQQLKSTFGIDELGVRQGELGSTGSRQPASRVAGGSIDTTASTGNQIFSVGKRLSSNALLSYEQSIGRAEGIVKLTVNLNRNLALIGRAGSDNAIDLFYTLTFGRATRPAKTTPR